MMCVSVTINHIMLNPMHSQSSQYVHVLFPSLEVVSGNEAIVWRRCAVLLHTLRYIIYVHVSFLEYVCVIPTRRLCGFYWCVAAFPSHYMQI